MVKYDYIMHCSHPVKCTLQKPCGLFSCAKSRDGGVTTRSLFIFLQATMLGATSRGRPCFTTVRLQGECWGDVQKPTCTTNLWHHKKDVYNAKIANHRRLWHNVCCLVLCSEEINPILFVIFLSVLRVGYVWMVSLF